VTLIKFGMFFLALCALAGVVNAEPLRLPSGEPLIGIYYFTHWWEPWRSDDELILADLRRLREMGFNTIFLDHEPSQMFDGEWAWLDRDHRLAREAGLYILPWLEAKCGKDVVIGGRFAEVEKRWGVRLEYARRQDGKPSQTLIWKPEFVEYMVAWTSDYIERYRDTGAILRIKQNGKVYMVVSPCVELGWELVSFDNETNKLFRKWLKARYKRIDKLNTRWGTSYKSFDEINPCDRKIFDYSQLQKEHQSPPVEDHVLFRAELCRDVFKKIAHRLKEKYPDLLLVGELPYEFDYIHPHAFGYKWEYAALPVIAEWADILVIRSGGRPSQHSLNMMADFTKRTGIKIILTHRISATQGPGEGSFSYDMARYYATQAAEYAHGIGYYSWNEMFDTHIAPNYPTTKVPPEAEKMARTREECDRLSARVARINQVYLDIVGVPSQKKNRSLQKVYGREIL